MTDKLLARTVSERMFEVQCGIVDNLLSNPAVSVRIIERHLAELSVRWSTLQEKYFICALDGVTDATEISANDDVIKRHSSEIIRLELACDKLISSIKTVDPASPTATSNLIKLERVKFRTFDGDIRKFPKFKSEFETYVQPLCQQNQLPFVLKSYLCDSVRREVEHIDHDIDAMWDRLSEKYGSIQKQIDYIMKDFKSLPACNNLQSTLNMISCVENAEADLKCMDASNELENSLIISYIERSMSDQMLQRWGEKIANDEDRKSSHTKLPKLLDFLRHWRWLIEYNNAEIRESPPDEYFETEASAPVRKSIINHANICSIPTSAPVSADHFTERKCPVTSLDAENSAPIRNCVVNHTFAVPSPASAALHSTRRNCLIHQNAHHPIWQCRVFQAMSLNERKEFIKLNKACTLCLETGHDSSECLKSFRCTVPNCQSRHNVLLHEPHLTA